VIDCGRWSMEVLEKFFRRENADGRRDMEAEVVLVVW
jgi:hypothetical protein